MAQVEIERDGAVMVVTLNRPAPQERDDPHDVRVARRRVGGGHRQRRHPLRDPHRRRGRLLVRAWTSARWRVTSPNPTPSTPTRRMKEDPGFIYRGLLKTYRPTKPVIAAVEGVAIAGGTEILQGTDIRVAGESARFGVSRGALVALPDGRIGGAPAPPDPLHGRGRHPAHRQAHPRRRRPRRIGLIGHVVPDGQALDKAREIAETINANGPLAVEAILRTLRETERHDRGGGVRATSSTYGRPCSRPTTPRKGRRRSPRSARRTSSGSRHRGPSTRGRRCWSARASRTSASTTRRRRRSPRAHGHRGPNMRSADAGASGLLGQVGGVLSPAARGATETRVASSPTASARPRAVIAELGVLQLTVFTRACLPIATGDLDVASCAVARRSTATSAAASSVPRPPTPSKPRTSCPTRRSVPPTRSFRRPNGRRAS